MNDQTFPLIDEEDLLIIAHRDAHFSGSFSAMKEYYSNPEAKGVFDERWLHRIDMLEHIAQHYEVRELLPEDLRDVIMQSRAMYAQLHKAVEQDNHPLARAILSEDDVDIRALQHIDPQAVMILAQSELFADPLFPGYGQAPLLAIELLGQMKYEPAMEILLSCIGGDFDKESAALEALRLIGVPAKKWALHQLHTSSLTKEVERAALIAIMFLPDPEIELVLKTKISSFPDMVQQYVHQALEVV